MKKHGMMIVGRVPEGACPVCAEKHDPSLPHNLQSLTYQYKFYDQEGRWPTWEDAHWRRSQYLMRNQRQQASFPSVRILRKRIKWRDKPMITMITARGNGISLMIEVAQGNPGCMQFLMELYKLPNGLETLLRLWRYGLKGNRAYQLWNDCCDRNAELVAEILEATEMGKLTKEELFHNIDQPYGQKFDIEEIRQREPIRKEGYLMKKHGMMIMGRVPEGICPECTMVHDPAMPHNQQSLAYQCHFYNQNGRWPTWTDAMAHCTEDVKEQWIATLKERGIEVE